jgi:hypothetical protein
MVTDMENMMKQSAENEEAALAVWVKQTGLEKTFEQFPEDVTVAFNTVAKLRASTRSTAGLSNTLPCDPLTEFWPPMRVKE